MINDLSNTTPIIIPVGNPNGIRVSNIVYDGDTSQDLAAAFALKHNLDDKMRLKLVDLLE